MNQQYLRLCTQVYELSKPKPPADAYAFYRYFVATANGPVLEPMCGSGRFLLPLLHEGFDVAGFDASQSMLQALADKAKAMKLQPNIWHGLVQDIVLPEQYGLIFIPSGSFSLLVNKEVVAAVCQIFFRHLKPGGLLLFEVDTLYAAVKPFHVWQGSLWSNEHGQAIALSQLSWLEDDINHVLCKYELIENQQIITTEIEPMQVRMWSEQALTAILNKSGFKDISVLKAFDMSRPPDDRDETMVYLCRKQ